MTPRVDPAITRALKTRGPILVREALDEAAEDLEAFEAALFALGVAIGVGRDKKLIDVAFAWAEARDREGRAALVPLLRGTWHAAGPSARQERRLAELVTATPEASGR